MLLLIIGKGVQVESETLQNNWNVTKLNIIAKRQYHEPHKRAEKKLSWLVHIWKLKAYAGSRFVQYFLHLIRSVHSYII
jgi:hypothetical protein